MCVCGGGGGGGGGRIHDLACLKILGSNEHLNFAEDDYWRDRHTEPFQNLSNEEFVKLLRSLKDSAGDDEAPSTANMVTILMITLM